METQIKPRLFCLYIEYALYSRKCRDEEVYLIPSSRTFFGRTTSRGNFFRGEGRTGER